MPDELDIEQPAALEAYLRRAGRLAAGERVEIRALAGGVSNRTVRVKRERGGDWVLKQALPKLRTAVDWFSDPARIRREAEGIRWLARLAPAGSITPLIFEDPDHYLLAMEAVPEPHENFKDALMAGRVDEGRVAAFGRLLGTIHREGWRRREELSAAFADRQFFQTLRLEPYYQYAAEQVPPAADFLRRLIDSTFARRLTLVHGDYSPKNVLIHAGRLVLLDHEVTHFGDPSFDLGFALAHLLSKAHHFPRLRLAFRSASLAFWAAYREEVATGDEVASAGDLEGHAARQTLGCLLARVAGRSPLEYLNEGERERQRGAVVPLMADPPATIAGLAAQFLARIEQAEDEAE